MQTFSRSLVVAWFVLLGAAGASAQSIRGVEVRKLNGPLDEDFWGDVGFARLSPDGRWAVYLADLEADEAFDLYSVPVDGSSPAQRLDGPLGASTGSFAVSDDSTLVVYRVGDNLYSRPLDGSSVPVALTALPVGRRVTSFLTSGTSVVYSADQDTDNEYDLYVVPIDGSLPSIRLNHELLPLYSVTAYAIAPGGQQVTYTTAHQGVDDCLFSVPITGGPVLQLTTNEVYDRQWKVSADGQRAVYFSELVAYYEWGLLSVPLDASTSPVLIHRDDSSPEDHLITSDSTRVVYTFDGYSLFSAPVDGSAPGLALTHALENGFQLTSDGTRVLYREDEIVGVSLESRPVDGSAPAVRLDASHSVEDFQVGPSVVVYRAKESGGLHRLFRAPLDGSAPPVRLDNASALAVTSFVLSADGQRVLYEEGRLSIYVREHDGLFGVSTSGAPAPILLANSGTAPAFAAGGRVLFNEVNFRDANELHSVPFAGGSPLRLSLPFTDPPLVDDVRRILVRGNWAVFQVGQGGSGDELHCARLDRAEPSFRIIGPAVFANDPFGVALSTSTDRLVYHAGPDSRLYSVALDVSPTARALPGPSAASPDGSPPFLLDPAETRALYRDSVNNRLQSVLIDGSAPPVLLTAGGVRPGFAMSLDGARAVFRMLSTGSVRLFSVPLDASAAPIRLSPTSAPSVDEFRISPDSTRVVFRADGLLYGVPIDGSAAAVQLSASISAPAERSVNFHLSRGGDVVFLGGTPENVWAVPVDGPGGNARRLSLAPPSGSPIQQFELTASGTRVVYVADHGVGGTFQLFSAHLAATADPVKLNGAHALALSRPFQLSPDGARVVFESSSGRLLAARVSGRSAPVLLSEPPHPGGQLAAFRIAGDSSRVFFVADSEVLGRDELYQTSILGGARPARLNAALVAGGDVVGNPALFEPVPSGAVYVADGEQDEVLELYLTTLTRTAPSAPPR